MSSSKVASSLRSHLPLQFDPMMVIALDSTAITNTLVGGSCSSLCPVPKPHLYIRHSQIQWVFMELFTCLRTPPRIPISSRRTRKSDADRLRRPSVDRAGRLAASSRPDSPHPAGPWCSAWRGPPCWSLCSPPFQTIARTGAPPTSTEINLL